jgi:hypothetical protein
VSGSVRNSRIYGGTARGVKPEIMLSLSHGLMDDEELPVEGVAHVCLGEDAELLWTIRSEDDVPNTEVILVRVAGHFSPLLWVFVI